MVFKRRIELANGTFKEYPHWWYRFKRNGVQIRVNTKQTSKRTAEEMEAAHRTRLAKGEEGLKDHRSIPTFKKFATRFKAAIATRCAEKPRTVKFYEQKLANLLDFEPLASARLDRIDEAMVEKFVQHRIKQNTRPAKKGETPRTVAPATVNRALSTLRRALRLAQEWQVIDRVPRIRMLPGERNRDFVLHKELEAEYLDACPEPLQDVALLILDTGLRVGEAIHLEWRDVRLAPVGGARFGYLQVREGKSRNAKRVVSLTQRVTDMLRERYETRTDTQVFSSNRGKPYRDTYLARLQQQVREKLNWTDEFVIHSLRHTMLSRLGEAGVDAFTIMKIAGHSSITISQRYVHPTPESLERAIEKLEAFNAPAVPKRGTGWAHDASGKGRKSLQVVDKTA